MDWMMVKEWLESRGHINANWDVEFGDDGIYCFSEMENTFISVFTRGDQELVVYVGMLKPKFTCGSSTGIYVTSPYDVTDFLYDHLDDMFDELMRQYVNSKNKN